MRSISKKFSKLTALCISIEYFYNIILLTYNSKLDYYDLKLLEEYI